MPEEKRSKRVTRSLLSFATLAGCILVATAVINAQQRFGAPRPAFHARGFGPQAPAFHSRGVIRSVPLVPHVGHPVPRRAAGLPFRDRWHRRRRVFECSGPLTGLNVQQLLSPYPGYGFDFEHLNAINRDLGIKAAIDPATQLQLRELENLGCAEVPSLGYLLLGDDYVVPDESAEESEQPAQPTAQPQIIIVQEQPPAAQTPAQASTPTQPEAPPVLEEGQFELVLSSGTQLQAVAFTRDGDKIIYITPEGARRMIALSELNIAATIRVNEEHGTPIQLSF